MISRNPKGIAIFSVVAFVLVVSIVVEAFLLSNAGTAGTVASPEATSTPTATPEPLTSTPTASPTTTPMETPTTTPTSTPTPGYTGTFTNALDHQPLAIMIDNLSDARPQSGLSNADVIYEALVEGAITRLMAIFGNSDSEVVGPVRSGRHYFMYWASEYNAVYVLAGASPQGYNAAESLGLARIDYTYGQGYFWRTRERAAPHNLYTNPQRLRDSFKDVGRGNLGGLNFKNDSPTPQVTTITLTHPDKYRVGYVYREQDNSYQRYVLRAPHVDALTGVQYHPKNVIVQIVPAWRIPGDTAGRMDMETVGNGPAYFFLDGRAIEGTWRKDSFTSPTRFQNGDGAEVLFNAGQTWIQIAPTNSILDYE
ncbi:MAG: DUF3048 domain-containing protein [Chloroflexi bacterium]|nr:DUF3048 domain-containing protein [Chloroflexota bacterium]